MRHTLRQKASHVNAKKFNSINHNIYKKLRTHMCVFSTFFCTIIYIYKNGEISLAVYCREGGHSKLLKET